MTDVDLLTRVQYQLLETPDGGTSWDSGLWGREEVLSLLNQRQSKLLKTALLLVSPSNPDPAVSIGQRRVDLPTDLIRLVTVVWQDSVTGLKRELRRSTSFEADHLIPTWDSTAATPLVFMEYETPTLQVQIAPGPTHAGTLDLLYVSKGVPLTGGGAALLVPDEFSHALMYGTIADLLSKDGRGKDLTRATYANQRVDLAVELARLILKGWA